MPLKPSIPVLATAASLVLAGCPDPDIVAPQAPPQEPPQTEPPQVAPQPPPQPPPQPDAGVLDSGADDDDAGPDLIAPQPPPQPPPQPAPGDDAGS